MTAPAAKRRVAIIGFAGSHLAANEASVLSAQLYSCMLDAATEVITKRWGLAWDDVVLVSGGAAWSDHVAVSLFLAHADTEMGALRLHIPVSIDPDTNEYSDNGKGMHWRVNPGYLANKLHAQFSRDVERDTFSELNEAAKKGAVLNSKHNGFHARNTTIATTCDYMLAFSWSAGDEPTEGGTADTWFKCNVPRDHKHHISMYSLVAKAEEARARGEKRRATTEK